MNQGLRPFVAHTPPPPGRFLKYNLKFSSALKTNLAYSVKPSSVNKSNTTCVSPPKQRKQTLGHMTGHYQWHQQGHYKCGAFPTLRKPRWWTCNNSEIKYDHGLTILLDKVANLPEVIHAVRDVPSYEVMDQQVLWH